MEALWKRNDILYISEDFEKIELKNIPDIKRLSNIENEHVPFYTTKFDKNSSISYVITNKWILIDEQFLNNVNEIHIVNTLINLNTGYEIDEERVFYGNIIDWKIREHKVWSGKNNTQEAQNNNSTRNNSDTEETTKNINSEEEVTYFKEKLEDVFLDLKNDFSFLWWEIQKKYNSLLKRSFYEKNNIHTFLEKNEINSSIQFFLISKFDLEKSQTYKNKKQYVDFIKNASEQEKKSLLQFQ